MLLSTNRCLWAALMGFWLFSAQTGRANNIQVTNAMFTGNTGTAVAVQFNMTWENSWRGGAVANWDAAWVFVKFRLSNGVWQHASLSPTGHTAPAGSQIDMGLMTPANPHNYIANPASGVLVYRNVSGSGTFALTGIQLYWDYSVQGVNFNDITQVQVHAIEMVYVRPGAFAAGSGGTETSAFTLTTISTATSTQAPSGTGSLGGQAGGYPTGQTPPSFNSWPNGFNAFYCMKYEVSQQGYVDFLNTLTYDQQVTRTATLPTSAAGTGALSATNDNRNGIDIRIPGVASTTPAVYACNLDGDGTYGEPIDGSDLACNYLSWGDLSAYMDWSGLRPMTEMEYEKACRGTTFPLANEFAWGTTSVAANPYTLANVGAWDEGIANGFSPTLGNALYTATVGAVNGPMRVGIFAANGNNNGRVTGGASYYGIMNLSDNLLERSVNLGTVNGKAFQLTHGNGALNATGNNNMGTMPISATGNGAGLRGGSFLSGTGPMRVSDRTDANTATGARAANLGGRCVRAAP
jgi:formylglycine-generating enzyme required for sulfatase activity